MSWYNPLTWSAKAQDDVLDKDNGLIAQVGSWIGNMNLTKEEVIKFNAKTVTSVQAFVVATLGESTERSKTRRAIAILWIKSQLGIVLMSCIAAPWDMELANFYYKLATSTLMITVTTAICIFFFGSHGIARFNESKKGE
jgi:hypothetical protein